MIRDSSGNVSISPESKMHLGCGLPPTGQVVDHGVRPSISTGVPSVMGTDMFGHLRTMLGVMRGIEANAYLGSQRLPTP